MLRDLSDAWGWLQRLIRRVERLESGSWLENSSITNGRMRFIGGLLRVDSGGRVEIVGTLEIDGATTVTGTFKVTGPWELAGNGTITGNVTGTGTLTWNGPWNLNGAGKIAGNTDLTGALLVKTGGKVTVQGGGGDVVLDSSFSAPRVRLGSAQVDGGASSFTFTVGTTVVHFLEQTIRIPAMATKLASTVPGGFVGAVYADAAGKFWKLT